MAFSFSTAQRRRLSLQAPPHHHLICHHPSTRNYCHAHDPPLPHSSSSPHLLPTLYKPPIYSVDCDNLSSLCPLPHSDTSQTIITHDHHPIKKSSHCYCAFQLSKYHHVLLFVNATTFLTFSSTTHFSQPHNNKSIQSPLHQHPLQTSCLSNSFPL